MKFTNSNLHISFFLYVVHFQPSALPLLNHHLAWIMMPTVVHFPNSLWRKKHIVYTSPTNLIDNSWNLARLQVDRKDPHDRKTKVVFHPKVVLCFFQVLYVSVWFMILEFVNAQICHFFCTESAEPALAVTVFLCPVWNVIDRQGFNAPWNSMVNGCQGHLLPVTSRTWGILAIHVEKPWTWSNLLQYNIWAIVLTPSLCKSLLLIKGGA